MFAMSNPNTRHHIVLHYFVCFFFASLALKILELLEKKILLFEQVEKILLRVTNKIRF